LAVCAIFRDEARYLAEWIAFHRLQGVQRFYLYDNLSRDDWRSQVDAEVAAGVVDATSWPITPGQAGAYEDCLQRHRDDARWIAFIDVDEFLFSPTGRPLPDVLRDFETFPGVVVNWRCYGPNGWQEPAEGLLIESHPRRAVDDEPNNLFVKSIVYPRKTRGPSATPHYFRYRGGNAVGEDRRPVYWSRREPATAELLRINHYFAKSWLEYRRDRGLPTAWDGAIGESGVGSWLDLPADEVSDDSILQFVPALKTALGSRKAVVS
jgi:hypothetical protein